MPKFAGLSCKTEITIAYGIDFDFLEIMTQALLVSGGVVSPVSSKVWASTGTESIFRYVGLIILHEDICKQEATENIGLSMIDEIEGTLSGKESPLLTQNLLICASNNEIVISAFSELHKIPRIILEPPHLGIACWSIERFNTFGKNPFKVKPTTYH